MATRHRNAIEVQKGACNPCAIANCLVAACKEVVAEGGCQQKDAAVRLIAHQLAFVTGVEEINNGNGLYVYQKLTDECREKGGMS